MSFLNIIKKSNNIYGKTKQSNSKKEFLAFEENDIFQKTQEFSSKEEYLTFEQNRINTNTYRINLCNTLIFFTAIYLVIFDIFRLKVFYNNNLYNYAMLFSHISLIILSSLWFIYYKFIRKKISIYSNKIIYWLFVNLYIYLAILGSFFNPTNNFKLVVYLIALFAIVSVIYILPLVWSITSGISTLILLTIIYFVEENLNNVRSYISELFFVFCFSCLLSYIVYKFYRNGYITHLKLLAKNKSLSQIQTNKANFFANVSHELKTPLNIIYSSEQMLEMALNKNNLSSDNFNRYLYLIKQNTNRTTKLIQNLIDITKIDSDCFTYRPANINIINVVEDITLSAADYIESKNISITFDTDIEEKIILCDPDMIERIMLNLLSNAVKFTKSGGSIFVNIHHTAENTFISVSDTGIGIPKSMQLSIFDRYIQVERNRSERKEGSGIGLSLVKSLVELHHGNLTLESEVGKGSTFTFSLPNVTNDDLAAITTNNSIFNNNDRIKIEFSDIE